MLNKDLPAPTVVQVPLDQYQFQARERGPSRRSSDEVAGPEMSADFILYAMDLRTAAQARGLMAYGTAADLWDVVARHVTLAPGDEMPVDP